MTGSNFVIKNLSCNFGCMLLESRLIKYVILFAYILYCLKKYESRSCAYFVVLGGMIFKCTAFPSKASSSIVLVHPYVQIRSHKVLVTNWYYRMCSLWYVITLFFFTVCFVVIHIALSISLKVLTCIYS